MKKKAKSRRQPKTAIIIGFIGQGWALRLRVGNTYFLPVTEKSSTTPTEYNDERAVNVAASRLSKATGFPIEEFS